MLRWIIASLVALTFVLAGPSSGTANADASKPGVNKVQKGKKKGKKKGKNKGKKPASGKKKPAKPAA